MFIADNKFSFKKVIEGQENTTYKEISTNVFTLIENEFKNQTPIFIANNVCLVKIIKIKVNDLPLLKEKAPIIKKQITNLERGLYEIWSVNHNVNDYLDGGNHIPDQHGHVTSVLEMLKKAIIESGEEVIDTPVNHNKISMRKKSTFNLNETHLDSFEGMRLDDKGDRKEIWRYLINIGKEDRTTSFCPYPLDIHKLIPTEFSKDLFDKLFKKLNLTLTHVIVNLPAMNLDTGEGYAIKYLATHLLHSEYGDKNDTLAIINSEI